MMNQIIVVGRLTKELEMEDKKIGIATLAVTRNYKDKDGNYETDILPIKMIGQIAEKSSELCKMGDLVGVKGTIQEKDGKIELVAEKVTFLSHGRNNGE